MTALRVTEPPAARRRAQVMAVALGKYDNAAAEAQTPARRGLQPMVLAALPFLDRPTHDCESAPCQYHRLKARAAIELFRGSLALNSNISFDPSQMARFTLYRHKVYRLGNYPATSIP